MRIRLGLLAALSIVGFASAQPTSALKQCGHDSDGRWLSANQGRSVSFVGYYQRDFTIGGTVVFPADCGRRSVVATTGKTAQANIDRFLGTTFPDVNFGGYRVYGRFVGKVLPPKSIYRQTVEITDVEIDPDKTVDVARNGDH